MMKRNVAILIMYNKDKKILMQHRSKDASAYPDHWGFFGGGIENAENDEEALHREIYEELRYKTKNPQFLFTQVVHDSQIINNITVFMQKYDETQKLELHEGQGYGWYTIAEAEKLHIAPHNKIILSKLQRYIQ